LSKNLLSVITVSFNSEETIADTLDSVKAQVNQDFEYIVIDGLSSDSTLDIVKKSNIADIIVSEKDNGIYDGMNKGINKANGKFIGFLNSDDLFADNYVTDKILKAIQKYDTDIIYGDITYFSKNINDITRSWASGKYIEDSFNKGWHPPHPAFYAKKEFFTQSGNFDCDLQIAADFELMLRFFNYTKKTPIYINKNFVLMREGGASHENRIQGNKDVLYAFKKNNIYINKYLYLWQRLSSKFLTRYVKYPISKILNFKK